MSQVVELDVLDQALTHREVGRSVASRFIDVRSEEFVWSRDGEILGKLVVSIETPSDVSNTMIVLNIGVVQIDHVDGVGITVGLAVMV